MKFIRIIAGLVLLCASFLAQAAPIQVSYDENGKLAGAKGIELQGFLYDVKLIYGKNYDQIYKLIDKSPIKFQDNKASYFATLAFVSQVIAGHPVGYLSESENWWESGYIEYQIPDFSQSLYIKTFHNAEGYSPTNPYDPTFSGGWALFSGAYVRGSALNFHPWGNELLYQSGIGADHAAALWSNKRSTVPESTPFSLMLVGLALMALSRMKGERTTLHPL